jgi:hypothetical protein
MLLQVTLCSGESGWLGTGRDLKNLSESGSFARRDAKALKQFFA